MASSSPSPPVAFNNPCSILHNNVLYVYQSDAFQILELTDGAKWKQETNGVSVTGAVCVKGGTDGDSSKAALYVVGGRTNSTTNNYTGMQRYSIADKKWTTITPLSAVTAQRQYHGAAYLNASSSILVYGGSQNGNTSPSTETFLMLMYPPYRIQSYPSTAPPVVNPTVLSWDQEQAIMVGGSTSNQKIFRFHPDPGWVDLGLTLSAPLPDRSVAQSALVTLDDSSKILFTYDMSKSPNTVKRTVLLNPGGLPAVYNQSVGDSTGSASATSSNSRMSKRATYLNTYPAYNSSSASTTTRTNFALALGQNDVTGIVGGDANSTVEFYNKLSNVWKPASDYVGAQQPLVSSTSSLAPSSTSFSSALPSSTHSPTSSSSSTPAAVPQSSSTNGLTILGGVLGGICGLAAILIILLLYLRQVRRKKRAQHTPTEERFQEDKPSFEEQGLQPLSRQAQPMGRSPVPSTIPEDRDSVAMFGPRSEKAPEPIVPPKSQLGLHSNGSGIGFGFKREKSPLTISKPMLPDLGDYQVRPSIELGKATPVTPTVVVDTGLVTALPGTVDNTKANQRKTDEGWAKYFSAEKEGAEKRDTTLTVATDATHTSMPSRGARGGFWPGSGVPEKSSRSPNKNALRDSEGRHLTAQKVITSSPNLTNPSSDMKTRTMSIAEGMEAKISSADSISTDVTDDEDYEDDHMTAYSSGVPESVHDHGWTPVGSNWSGPRQQSLRPTSFQAGAHDFPPPTNTSNTTNNTESTKSSLPNFPMPATTTRRLQPSVQPSVQQPGLSFAPGTRGSTASSSYAPRIVSEDYFSRSIHLATTVTPQPEAPRHQREASQPAAGPTDPSDMSWINLGTPAAGPPSVESAKQSQDSNQPSQYQPVQSTLNTNRTSLHPPSQSQQGQLQTRQLQPEQLQPGQPPPDESHPGQ